MAISSDITSSRMRRPCSSTALRWTPGPRRRSSLQTSALASSGPRTRQTARPMQTARWASNASTARLASGASTVLRASAYSGRGMGVVTGRVPSCDAVSTAGKRRWIRSCCAAHRASCSAALQRSRRAASRSLSARTRLELALQRAINHVVRRAAACRR